jgi:hypothetical protein
VLENRDLGVSDLSAESGLYLRPGCVSSGMQNPRHAVSRFARKGYLPVEGVEGHSELDQVGDTVRGFVSEDADGFFVAESRPCGDGVFIMQFGGVLDADCGCYPALGMARVAVVYTALGNEKDASVLFGKKRAVQAGDPAADDYIVVLFNIGPPRYVTGLFGFRLFLSYCHAGKADGRP